MKNFFICVLFLITPIIINAQSVDVGGGVGVTYYNGDINPDAMFYKPNLGIEGFVRYNFNSRYSVRGNVMVSDFEAYDKDFIVKYQQQRRASFQKSIVEVGVMGEVNFFPFTNPSEWKTKKGTFFILTGVLMTIPYKTDKEGAGFLSVPIGAGYKRDLPGRWAIQIEWTFRKTFTDYFDNVADPLGLGEKSKLFNNDWYNLLSVKLSLNLYDPNAKCRTFER